MALSRDPRLFIAHVIYRFAVGGLENGLVNLINGLPREKFRHAVICIDRSTDFAGRIDHDDVEIVEIRKRPGRDPAALVRIYKELRRLQPDILHTRNLGALDALLPAFLAGIKRRIHGEHGWDIDDLDGQDRRARWIRKLYSPLITEYVSVSRQLQSYMIDQVGIRSERIHQIYNGVDTNRFSPNPNKLEERQRLSPVFEQNSILIGTVGRIHPVKGHTDLVDSFIKLTSEYPDRSKDTRLVIAGDGELRGALWERLDDAGIGDRCWLPGHRDDIPRIMSCLDIFVQPSLAEGISNTILEAMSCGLPVIATDVGGNGELIKPANGVLVPASSSQDLVNAIITYLDAKDLIGEHGRMARTSAMSLFSLESMLGNYCRLYRGGTA